MCALPWLRCQDQVDHYRVGCTNVPLVLQCLLIFRKVCTKSWELSKKIKVLTSDLPCSWDVGRRTSVCWLEWCVRTRHVEWLCSHDFRHGLVQVRDNQQVCASLFHRDLFPKQYRTQVASDLYSMNNQGKYKILSGAIGITSELPTILAIYLRKSSIVLVDPSLFRVWIMFAESRNQQNLRKL